MKTHDTVAELPFSDFGTDGDDRAGKLVAQNLRRLNVAVKDFLDVGPADATSSDFDESFALADFGDGNFFDADDAFFAVNAGTHGLGDRAEGAGGFEGWGGTGHR